MNPRVIREVNRLWEEVYPYLARYVMDLYGDQEGDVLELGPFSGGISKEFLSLSPHWKIVIAGELLELFDPLKEEIRGTTHAKRIMFKPSPLFPLVFLNQSFDLVIFRGAFFFLSPSILQEVYRVLRPEGLAILGGGYGPHTPLALIGEKAEESKRLNKLLGKRWTTKEEVARMIQEASLEEEAEISEEGGLWVILRKGKEEVGGGGDLGLAQALCLGHHEIISLVGAGGKTALLFALAEELCARGAKVITTTTTKIFEPTGEQVSYLIIEENHTRAMELVREGLSSYGHVTLAAKKFAGEKIGEVSPDLIERIDQELPIDHIIVEADGAKRLPIKAPADHEPVVPPATSLLIPMVGIDALGRPLGEEAAFRPSRIAELTGATIGDPITPQVIASLIIHPQGLIKGTPPRARVIPFLNKVETQEGLEGGREVAHEVLRNGDQRIEGVVLGRLFYRRPIVEVIRRKGTDERDL
ncbi:MAG: putative selenium-dependent hydroxylase accessory protein YqeC [Deltaproteobacteria bacterium]|nr:putative selenium-dependent hydroxylase accessory protein YqeC [Deltaproteobacteria bacterium]